MTLKVYTGIGSRSTPASVLAEMTSIARQLASRGWLLRSGGADGADTAFEQGCVAAFGRKEIYLPWRRFNNRSGVDYFYTTSEEARDIAESVYGEQWKWLRGPVRKLHARNVHQVLGRDLRSPSQFVLCWTPRGEDVGGTRTAIVLARAMKVRVINLAVEVWDWDLINQELI